MVCVGPCVRHSDPSYSSDSQELLASSSGFGARPGGNGVISSGVTSEYARSSGALVFLSLMHKL